MTIEPFVRCRDVSRSVEFYSGYLDFVVIQAPDPDPASLLSKYAYLERGGSYIHLSAHLGDGVFGNKLYIKVTALDEFYASLLSKGLQVGGLGGVAMEPVEQTWGMKEFSVTDPDGNWVVFAEKIDG